MPFLAVATLLVDISVTAQEAGFNDLTTVGANPLMYKKFASDSSCHGGSGGGRMGIGCPPATYPFELLLIGLDSANLTIGGAAVALLRLRNVGNVPATVPWSADPDEIELPDDDGSFKFVEADFGASIAQEGGRSYIIIPVHLYGAKDVPGSLQEIRPGEYVELKIAVVIDCGAQGTQCQSLKAGPAKLSFIWTENDTRVIYEKCGTQSFQTRIRQLSTKAEDVSVAGRTLPGLGSEPR